MLTKAHDKCFTETLQFIQNALQSVPDTGAANVAGMYLCFTANQTAFMDKLSQLVGRHTLSVNIFFNGEFCDSNEFVGDGQTGQIHIVRSGTVIFSHDGMLNVEVTGPAIMFYPRGMSHRLSVPGGDASLVCAHIRYEHGFHNSLARVLPPSVHVPMDRVPEIRATLEMLIAESKQAQLGSAMILDRLFDVLAMQLVRHQYIGEGFSMGLMTALGDRHLSPVLAAIHERPQHPWQLASMAKLAGMSRSAFAEHFAKTVGQTPAAYLAQWRMTLAQRLLRSGLPVKVVSERTGYGSASVFSRAFANEIGKSPTRWLQEAAA